MSDDVTGDFNRTPTESVLDPMLAEVQADHLTVPQDEGEGLLTAFEDALDEEDDMDQTTFNAMLRVALAGLVQTEGVGVLVETPTADFVVSAEGGFSVTAANVQLTGTGGGVSLGGDLLAVFGGDGLAEAGRPAVATQVGSVDVDAFNRVRDALVDLGVVVDGDG